MDAQWLINLFLEKTKVILFLPFGFFLNIQIHFFRIKFVLNVFLNS
jgi:hypothetical protein